MNQPVSVAEAMERLGLKPYKNVFECIVQLGSDDNYEPKEVTDGPMKAQPGSDEAIAIIAARIERGEECFHPEELPPVIDSSETGSVANCIGSGKRWKGLSW